MHVGLRFIDGAHSRRRTIFRTRVCERNNIILKDIFQKKSCLGGAVNVMMLKFRRAVVTDRFEGLRPRKFFSWASCIRSE